MVPNMKLSRVFIMAFPLLVNNHFYSQTSWIVQRIGILTLYISSAENVVNFSDIDSASHAKLPLDFH